MFRQPIVVKTANKGLTDITRDVQHVIERSGLKNSMCNVFLHHTSASVLINENADYNVLRDLEAWMSRLVTDGDALFLHREEGPDDMSAHIRAALTATSISIPVIDGKLGLGTWQGIFVWEHREHGADRRVTVTVWGD